MDEIKLLEAMYAVRDVAASDAMNFFTIMSGYLVVAYFIGEKLNRFQFWAVTLLYTVFCGGPIFGFFAGINDMVYLSGLSSREDAVVVPQIKYSWLVPMIMFLAWCLSIAFMLNVRSQPKEEQIKRDS